VGGYQRENFWRMSMDDKPYAEVCMMCKKKCKQKPYAIVEMCPEFEPKAVNNEESVGSKVIKHHLSKRKKLQHKIAEKYKGKL